MKFKFCLLAVLFASLNALIVEATPIASKAVLPIHDDKHNETKIRCGRLGSYLRRCRLHPVPPVVVNSTSTTPHDLVNHDNVNEVSSSATALLKREKNSPWWCAFILGLHPRCVQELPSWRGGHPHSTHYDRRMMVENSTAAGAAAVPGNITEIVAISKRSASHKGHHDAKHRFFEILQVLKCPFTLFIPKECRHGYHPRLKIMHNSTAAATVSSTMVSETAVTEHPPALAKRSAQHPVKDLFKDVGRVLKCMFMFFVPYECRHDKPNVIEGRPGVGGGYKLRARDMTEFINNAVSIEDQSPQRLVHKKKGPKMPYPWICLANIFAWWPCMKDETDKWFEKHPDGHMKFHVAGDSATAASSVPVAQVAGSADPSRTPAVVSAKFAAHLDQIFDPYLFTCEQREALNLPCRVPDTTPQQMADVNAHTYSSGSKRQYIGAAGNVALFPPHLAPAVDPFNPIFEAFPQFAKRRTEPAPEQMYHMLLDQVVATEKAVLEYAEAHEITVGEIFHSTLPMVKRDSVDTHYEKVNAILQQTISIMERDIVEYAEAHGILPGEIVPALMQVAKRGVSSNEVVINGNAEGGLPSTVLSATVTAINAGQVMKREAEASNQPTNPPYNPGHTPPVAIFYASPTSTHVDGSIHPTLKPGFFGPEQKLEARQLLPPPMKNEGELITDYAEAVIERMRHTHELEQELGHPIEGRQLVPPNIDDMSVTDVAEKLIEAMKESHEQEQKLETRQLVPSTFLNSTSHTISVSPTVGEKHAEAELSGHDQQKDRSMQHPPKPFYCDLPKFNILGLTVAQVNEVVDKWIAQHCPWVVKGEEAHHLLQSRQFKIDEMKEAGMSDAEITELINDLLAHLPDDGFQIRRRAT